MMSIFDVIEEELRLRSIDLQNVFHNTNLVCKNELNLQHKFKKKTNLRICEINLRISMVEIKSSVNFRYYIDHWNISDRPVKFIVSFDANQKSKQIACVMKF